MTTIAATLEGMAADSRVNLGETSYLADKLWRVDDVIIGCAGDNEAIAIFRAWWPTQDIRKFRIPKRLEFEALVLSSDGLLYFEHSGPPDLVKDGRMAIGTGGVQALAAMDTMEFLGRKIDPRKAVRIACKRNPDSGEPVQWLPFRKKR